MKLFSITNAAVLALTLSAAVFAAASAPQAGPPECGEYNQGDYTSDATGSGAATHEDAAEAEILAEIAALNDLQSKVNGDLPAGVTCPTEQDCKRPRHIGCDPDGWYDGISDVTVFSISAPLDGGGYAAVARASLVAGTDVEAGCSTCMIAPQRL